MGQTLPNGIYLPAEGERNCYDGLEGNWRSLDGLISTVAGKASATHTHGNISNDGKVGTTANKPLITGTGGVVQAGSFGNQANTFCEGNDSRLSDARTPVAHTHGKSDVTDLLNSNFIPSANNTYDLGSSSQQWNNVYSKNYYYNGVAWGLDKANRWGAVNVFSREIKLEGDRGAYIAPMWEGAGSGISLLTGDGYKPIYFGVQTNDANNRKVLDSTRGVIRFTSGETGGNNIASIEPINAPNSNLGTSTNKWKTLNGVNPGALSLPGEYSSSVTEYITDKTGENNVYTAPADGWVGIQASSATFASENFIFMGRTSDGTTYYAQNALSPINSYWSNSYHGCILLPVISGKTYGIRCKCDSVDARFYKANGNVS